MKTLFVIPARGGSKGIPRKNIKPLAGKPLVYYSIDVARSIVSDDCICLSSDDKEIISCVESYGLKVPFIRPAELSEDNSGSVEVMLHAINYYEQKGAMIDTLVWLQPTSPFRSKKEVEECLSLFSKEVDMVVSVKESTSNPYYNLFEVDEMGYLVKSKKSNFKTRQSLPPVYQFNGSVYVINVNSLKKYKSIVEFPKIVKYVMDEFSSQDLDTELDWNFCEYLIEKKIIKLFPL